MSPKYIDVGDMIADSPVGAGEITGVTLAGFPKVNHIAVTWIERTDGVVWDPHGKRKPVFKAEACLTA